MDNQVPKIHVLIIGAGIGGLMLGLMLERAGIDYQILERSPEHRPLGSAISLNGTVLRLFEQLGLLDDLYKISKTAGRLHLVKEDLETQGHVDLEHFHERYGYHSVVFGRPDLFKMLDSHIPPEKILMGKRVLSTSQTEEGVLVRCSDGTTYHGDVLVGADGAYSSIRQCMHKTLKEKGMLPKSDSEKLKFDQHCVVGITDELDPEKFPILKEDLCELYGVIGKKRPYTIWLVPIVGNRFAWSIGGRILDSEVGQEDVRSFNFAEWWPELASDVCDLVRDYTLPDFKLSYQQDEHYKNVALGDEDIHDEGHPMSETASLSDSSSCHSYVPSEASPISSGASSVYGNDSTGHHPHKNAGRLAQLAFSKDLQNQHQASSTSTSGSTSSTDQSHPSTNHSHGLASMQSKLFKVWHHERTVLLGDACHKVLPFAGQGAIQAILDGISLANALFDLKSSSIENITKAFKRYSNERIPIARAAVVGSSSFGKLLNVQGRLSNFIRRISFSKVPEWILRLATDKLHLHRPQLSFLPMVPDRGSAKAYKQEYSPRYLARLVHDQQASTDPSIPAASVASATVENREHEPKVGDKHRVDHSSKSSHHHKHNHHRHHHVSKDPNSSRKMSAKPGAPPPPLPLGAPPRHHPTTNMQYHSEERFGGILTPSCSSSTTSSPSSSSFSLVSGATSAGNEDAHVHIQPKTRRNTLSQNQNNRSQPTSPRVLPREASLPSFLHDTYNHHSLASPMSSSHSLGLGDGINEFSPQLYTPPRSPAIGTSPVNPRMMSAPIVTQFKESHQRTKSLQPDLSPSDSIMTALEQTAAMMKERCLNEHRSLDQIKQSARAQTQQKQQQQE
ncbi:hypothetical protein BGZ65_008396 [Modicella reniformis]|uniref:FAD-binding domain-containing protein n=1 Tax=Modicella reniformis TaxID=1440133 RepID=A0A9P6MKC5_9FUNG|nr:hypothetical protein BGZ65_008396 [Modicella reniformis]